MIRRDEARILRTAPPQQQYGTNGGRSIRVERREVRGLLWPPSAALEDDELRLKSEAFRPLLRWPRPWSAWRFWGQFLPHTRCLPVCIWQQPQFGSSANQGVGAKYDMGALGRLIKDSGLAPKVKRHQHRRPNF